MFFTYLITLIIAFLGLFLGLLIGYFVEEELEPGRKYFDVMRHALFVVILILFFVKNPSFLFIIFVGLVIIIFSFSKHREILYYYAPALIFFLSWRFNGFTLIAPLIFLYGFPVGSIYLYNHLKEKKKKKKMALGIFRQYVGFLIVGILLGLIGLLL